MSTNVTFSNKLAELSIAIVNTLNSFMWVKYFLETFAQNFVCVSEMSSLF